ncbi:MAG: NAD-dependent deacylase [Phycisphaerae bacterium]|nr:NAD-dependent deacylase [Phycisphaerae bacterium]NUQ48361.1 NAD-dependent deacylase [Phycisphaerae bacterium]
MEHAARLLSGSGSVCVSTGAGMSAESGVATFRDAGGLWSRFDPSQLATPEAFARDPVRVWEWYRQRRAQLRTIEPHEGHRVLAAWERRFPDFSLVTQNVDGLHTRAGSRRVIELHGRLDVARCQSCPCEIHGLDDLGPDPRCPECGERVRPGVVWFGELLPPDAVDAAFDAAARCDVILVIGTSGVVHPAAGLVEAARTAGASVIEINPNESALSGMATARIALPCGQALGAIDRVLCR